MNNPPAPEDQPRFHRLKLPSQIWMEDDIEGLDLVVDLTTVPMKNHPDPPPLPLTEKQKQDSFLIVHYVELQPYKPNSRSTSTGRYRHWPYCLVLSRILTPMLLSLSRWHDIPQWITEFGTDRRCSPQGSPGCANSSSTACQDYTIPSVWLRIPCADVIVHKDSRAFGSLEVGRLDPSNGDCNIRARIEEPGQSPRSLPACR